jgi:hypothetical protein
VKQSLLSSTIESFLSASRLGWQTAGPFADIEEED